LPETQPTTTKKCSRGIYGCAGGAEENVPEPIEDRPTVFLPAEDRRPPAVLSGLEEGWETVLRGLRMMWRAVRG